ncbi:hypothetical protein GPALN_014405 [Globodera pallida]|nr:hypothetical protein GPALN_014405 [Globodera pallida]
MDCLISMESLDVHCNMIGRLPDELLRCRSLKTLDVSGNQLTDVPLNIGELHNLVELVLCENQIRHLPSSIGQLKRLEVLKASKNNLTVLTPSICSCALLTDLQLQVLDLADNSLQYLPYTLTVLYKAKTLAALWLSFNQPSLPKLTTTHEPVMNIKVLTCYLLPQKGVQQDAARVSSSSNKSCVGGARVCFAGDAQREEDDKIPIGRFERYDTPHPKPFAPKNRLSRNSGDFTGIISLSAHPAHHQKPSTDASPGGMECQTTGKNAVNPHGSIPPDALVASGIEESRPLRSALKRRPQSVISHISTPELLSLLNNAGGADGGAAIGEENFTKKVVRKNVQLRKGAAGFEWTIVGGANSLPYKDKSGLFISQLVPAGAADAARFRVGDCLLAVNSNDLRGLTHQEAIQLIQNAGHQLDLLIEREQQQQQQHLDDNRFLPNNNNNTNVYASEFVAVAAPLPRPPERCCAMIVRNKCGLPGFTVSGAGRWPEDPFTVGQVDVATDSLLRAADRIISVGGTNVKFGARLDQVKTLLAGFPGTRVEVVVERGGDWPPSTRAVPPKLTPNRYAAAPPNAYTAGGSGGGGIGIGGTSSLAAFGQLSQTRSLPSLFEPQNGAGPSSRGGPSPSPAHCQAQNHPNDDYFKQLALPPLMPYIPSPSAAACRGTASPRRQHRSFSNLLMDDGMVTDNNNNNTTDGTGSGGGRGAVAGKSEMLRASTCHVRTTNGMKMDEKMNATLPMPNSSTSFSARIDYEGTASASSPPLPPKMSDFQHQHHQQNGTIYNTHQQHSMAAPTTDFSTAQIREPPMATSSPIPRMPKATEATTSMAASSLAAPVTKPSHIPVAFNSSTTATTTTMAATMKMPPPVAPKPKVLSNNEKTLSSDYVQHQHQQQSVAVVQLQQHQQKSSPPSPTASSFSFKLKLFEAHSRTGPPNAVTNVPSKSSGIPLKKPLVCAQDLEKLKEAEQQDALLMRQRMTDVNKYQHQLQNGKDGMETDEDEEHRDTVHELTRLLSTSPVHR